MGLIITFKHLQYQSNSHLSNRWQTKDELGVYIDMIEVENVVLRNIIYF